MDNAFTCALYTELVHSIFQDFRILHRGEKKNNKKTTAKRFGPFQISVAEIEASESDRKEKGRKKPSLAPGAIGRTIAHKTPVKVDESEKNDLHAFSTSRM